EFYANLTVFIYKKKEIAKSRVRGVEIEFDNMKLASILNVPGHTGISEYIKENVVPRFVKRDTISFMDLTYMDHLVSGRKINLPRHMAYVIAVKDHELPYVYKQGEEPKRYDYFEETFLTMCKLTRENGVWWIGTGENRRRDVEIEAPAEEVHEEEEAQNVDFDREAVIDEAAVQGESGSDDQFFDAQVDVEEPVIEAQTAPSISSFTRRFNKSAKERTLARADPLGPSGHIPESVMIKLQAEFERARANRIQSDLEKAQAENARLLDIL
ncbi:hypothetical protein Dimus_035727, partial [Dionaea muscipula]